MAFFKNPNPVQTLRQVLTRNNIVSVKDCDPYRCIQIWANKVKKIDKSFDVDFRNELLFQTNLNLKYKMHGRSPLLAQSVVSSERMISYALPYHMTSRVFYVTSRVFYLLRLCGSPSTEVGTMVRNAEQNISEDMTLVSQIEDIVKKEKRS